MNDEDRRLTGDEAEKLLASVLHRTTGAACRRAEELLCDLTFAEDGLRAGDEAGVAAREDGGWPDRALLAAHLEHCKACADLATALQHAAGVLPSLASLDPGPGFTWAVLQATSRAMPTRAARLAGWWRGWLVRPRFAFELAYVATLLLVLIVGNPAQTLQAASARTATAAAAGLHRARSAWPAIDLVAAEGAEAPVIGRIGSASAEMLGHGAALRNDLDGFWGRALQALSSSLGWLRGAATYLLDGVRGTWSRLRTTALEWLPQPASRPARGAAGRAEGGMSRADSSEPGSRGAR
jgi:hypothetical protein